MGLYDREYARDDEPGFRLSAPQTATTQIIVVTIACFVAQLAAQPSTADQINRVTDSLALDAHWFQAPWNAYQLLTYGFLHDTENIAHIVVNLLILWMFGREIEQRYGRREFFAFYLSAIVIAGLGWSLIEAAVGGPAKMVGASGGVAGVVSLFAMNFPHRRVLFMFVIPMPMWLAALIGVGYDALGAMERTGNVACTAHLAGAAFGLFYFYYGWPVGRLLGAAFTKFSQRNRPRLRVLKPEDGDGDEPDDLSRKVDEILAKIQEKGQDSLSWSERRLLEKASRQYQQKRK